MFVILLNVARPIVIKLLQKLFLSLAMLSILMDSTVIQITAWVSMVPTRLVKTRSLEAAVESTFSGEYPCPLCKIAAETREQEQNEEESTAEYKKSRQVFCKSRSVRLGRPPSVFFGYRLPGNLEAPSRRYLPETPPPESFC